MKNDNDPLIEILRNVTIGCIVMLVVFAGYKIYTDPGLSPTVEDQSKWETEAKAKSDLNAIDSAQWLLNHMYYVHDTAHDVCYSMYIPNESKREYTYVPCTLSVKWIDISPDNP